MQNSLEIKYFALVLLGLLVLATGCAVNKPSFTDTNVTLELLDPMQEDAGDFLDTNVMELQKKAFEAYQKQHFEEAARLYLTLLQYNIRDANSIYNLACCYGLLGQQELASKYLVRSVKAGFNDIGHVKKDPDFDRVRGTKTFDDVVVSIEMKMNNMKKDEGKLEYYNGTILLKSRIHFPEDYNENESYPLLVGLHGYGDNLDNFSWQWKKVDDPKFIYITLQAPYAISSSDKMGYSWNIWCDDKEFSNRVSSQTESYIADAVKKMKQDYNISSVYLMGFSQGAGFTYTTAIPNHKLFDGIICYGGWLDMDRLTKETISAAKDLRVFIVHGKNDRIVIPESATIARDKLIENGYSVEYVEFDGGHQIPKDVFNESIEWMLNE